ncbi:MAG TPA: alpha-aminoadipate/glutamate carrier protein LysW/ArgW [Nitrososphaerales archaeon]|nr:alpha-aminoadipate/glutamate carrier protein LysW/ArgW [Nitrososphaerales archaeon]
MMNSKCAECDAGVAIPSDAIVGEIVSCKECGAEYEVTELNGDMAMLKPAEQVEEDWGE